MFISRAPFRISLMGGGSDIPNYYRQFGGKVVSFTIDKFVYVATNPSLYSRYRFVYSRIEEVDNISEIKHPIVFEIAKDYTTPYIDFSSFADVPAGTGLGSSSAFTAAVALNLAAYSGKIFSADALAGYACSIELDRLGEPIGKQDQYAVCHGGLNTIIFNQSGNVEIIPHSWVHSSQFLERHMSVVFTGVTRRASSVLKEQSENFVSCKGSAACQHEIVSMVDEMCNALLIGDAKECGRLIHHNWLLKKQLTKGSDCPSAISELYAQLLTMGAYGGKVLGAGNGGFIAVFHGEGFRERIRRCGHRVLDFKFWPSGAERLE